MKRVLSLAASILVIAAIIGCEKLQPEVPTLIEPEDGAVFDTLPPTFIWSSDELADDYVIRIYMGSSTDIQDTLSDTTYAMPQAVFDNLANGTYNWSAASMSEEEELFWSESRSFVVDKPEEPQGLDLDTTYFPFGLGYEWCYARYQTYTLSGWGPDEDTSWERFDTVSLAVTDSFWRDDTLFFELDGSYMVMWNWKIHTPAGWVNLTPEPMDTLVQGIRTVIEYKGDTLYRADTEYSPYVDDWSDTYYGYRLKGIGEVIQGFDFWHYDLGIYEYGSCDDRLLYFYNGQDTVYKAHD